MLRERTGMEELERVCEGKRVFIMFDTNISDGDIFYNPTLRIVLIGNHVDLDSVNALEAVLRGVK